MAHCLTELPSHNRAASTDTSSTTSRRCDRAITIAAKAGSLVCDFRPGCALISDVFPDRAAFAQAAIRSTLHLAETLFQAGLITNGRAAIDMALAMQEARTCSPTGCSCLSPCKAK